MAALAIAILVVPGCRSQEINSPLATDPDAKKMMMISVKPYDPGKVDYMIEEARRSTESTGVDMKAFKFGIYPSSSMAEIERDAENFGRIRQELEGSGVKAGILFVVSVGQGWVVGPAPIEPMEYSVNQLGELNYRICLRDKMFRKHIYDSIAAFARRRPTFILMDDDFRMINNSKYGTECFCDSHMKIYNGKMPRKFASAGELVDYLKQAPADDPCVKIFEAERRDMLLDHARLIRSAIDSVDPSIPCGYCSGGGEYLTAGDIARTLAGKNKSFMRIHNSNYMELEPQQFNLVMYHGVLGARAAGNVDYILDESDTYARSRYHKSAISMHSHIVGAILYGCSGAKLWLDPFINLEANESNKGYEEIMKANRRFYDALLAEMPHVTWQGPATPLVDYKSRFNPARANENGMGLLFDIQTCQLNRFGIPARYEYVGDSDVYVLNGQLARAMTDDELRKVLSSRVVLEGKAAVEVARRGMTEYLGCVPKLSDKFYPAVEKMTYGPRYRIPIHSDGTVPNLTDVAPSAEILTMVEVSPGTEGRGDVPGPGTILYRNPAGGTVVTRAMPVTVSRVSDELPEVKMLLLDIFRRIDPGLIRFHIGEEQPVHFRCGSHDRGGYLLAMVNLSFDAMTEIDLRTQEKVSSVEFLDGDGVYKPLDFKVTGKGIVVDRRLDCYAPLILRVK